MNSELKRKNRYNWWIALACIVSMDPYFVWPTFSTILCKIPVFIYAVATVILLCDFPKKIELKKFYIGCLFTVMWIYTLLNGSTNQYLVLGRYVPIALVWGLLFCDDEKKIDIFEKFKKMFIVTLIPGMLFWFFEVIGIKWPFPGFFLESSNQAKKLVGGYYTNYILFLKRIDLNRYSQLPHLCGIYDEQGMVGTFAGLLFTASGMKIKDNKWNLLMFIQGCMSLSLAFFAIVAIAYTIKICFSDGLENKIRVGLRIAIFLTIIIIVIECFVPKESLFYNAFVKRFTFSKGSFVGDNRVHEYFKSEYNNFKKNSRDYLLGLGRDSYANLPNTDSSTYLILIYEYGIIGFLLILFYHFAIFLYYFKNNIKMNVICPFFVVFIASIYQRPYVLTIVYMIMYMTALAYCNSNEENTREQVNYNKFKKYWRVYVPYKRIDKKA